MDGNAPQPRTDENTPGLPSAGSSDELKKKLNYTESIKNLKGHAPPRPPREIKPDHVSPRTNQPFIGVRTGGPPTPPSRESRGSLPATGTQPKVPNAYSEDKKQIEESVNVSSQPSLASVGDKDSQSSLAALKGSLRVLQLEGMDSVNWDQFESRFTTAAEKEPPHLQSLFDLHGYDVQVETRTRSVPNQEFLESLLQDPQLNSFSRECVKCFLSNWRIVKGSFFDFSLDRGATGGTRRIMTVNVDKSTARGNPRDDRISPRYEDNQTGRACIDPTVFTQTTEEALSMLKRNMDEYLPKHLFKAMHEELNSEDVTTSSQVPTTYLDVKDPFDFPKGNMLQITCQDLSFASGIDEPCYISFALHDIKSKVKLSETFYCHFNKDSFAKLGDKECSSVVTCKKFIFSASQLNKASTYLIVRVEKLFGGDIEKDIGRYLKKASSKSHKSPEVVSFSQDDFVRQPFMWTAVKLYFDEKKFLEGQVTLDEFRPFRNFSNDEYIYDQLAKELDLGKKGKLIQGNLSLLFESVANLSTVKIIDPSGFYASSKRKNKPKRFKKGVKELQLFSEPTLPYFSYVNNLYVYPQVVVAKQLSAPNITVTVQLRDDDSNPDAPGLPVIYSSWYGDHYTTKACTSVTYKEKRPQFYDEIKLKLPGVLTEKHHLVFTVTNGPNEIIGYSYCPLYSNSHGIIKNARRSLPLVPHLVPNYLSQELEPVKIAETKKSAISLDTRVISSIYPESNALYSLSSVLTNEGKLNKDGNPEQVLQVLQRLPAPLCVAFFPALLNCLFKIICAGDKKCAPLAVICLVTVLKKVRESSGEKNTTCNSLLLSYVRYLFDPPQVPDTVHDVFCTHWLDFLEERPELKNLEEGETWIMLNIMLKSMILKICENGPPSRDARLTAFSRSFTKRLEELVLTLFCVEKEIRNMDILTMVPLFMKDLLGIIDRGVVFEMIYGYISWLNSENHTGDLFLATVKFTFMKLITDNKYYVPLNSPHSISLAGDTNTLVANFWTEHFFSGLIVREVRAGLLQKQRIREQSISILKNLLHAHDIDPRYGDPEKKARIAGLYFPFVITTIEFHQVLQEYLVYEEKVNWLLCFFYIVENCERHLLHQIWKESPSERRGDFFAMMEMATEVFKGKPLYNAMCFIMVDIVLEYVTFFQKELLEPNSSDLPKIFQVLQHLQHNQSTGFIVALYHLLPAITNLFSKPLFCFQDCSYCGSVSYQVLFHCNSEKVTVRSKASSLFYHLLKKNFEETGDTCRMQLQSTISLSRLLSDTHKVKEYSHLTESLELIRSYSKNEQNTTLRSMIEEAVGQINRLLRFNQQLAENDKNPELQSELILKIADSYKHSPDLRMTWLEGLANHLSDNKAWTEASLAHVQLACIIAEYMERMNGNSPVSLKSFKSVLHSVDLNSIPDDLGVSSEKFVHCNLPEFIKHIEKAVLLMKQSKQYELCTELYCMLVLAHKDMGNYAKLMDVLTEFNHSTAVQVEANKDLRILATYFRVAFYSELLEENEKAYIYRCDAKENLMTIQQRIKANITNTYGIPEDKIEVIGNQQVNQSSLNKNTVQIQIAMVVPHIPEPPVNDSVFAKHFGVRQFLFESSFGKGEQQTKKKTIFTVKHSFPYVTTRLEVIDTQEILLTPLESAIDLIHDRIAKFKDELNVGSKAVRVNQLQQLLQGSVVPMVHEGPLKICETFLSPKERGEFRKDQILQLEEAMSEFIKLCGFAVKLTNQVIVERQLSEYQQFQSMIEKQYGLMRDKIKPYIINAK